MTKTWLECFDREEYKRLIGSVSVGLSSYRGDARETPYRDSLILIRAVAAGTVTKEAGRVLLSSLINDIRQLAPGRGRWGIPNAIVVAAPVVHSSSIKDGLTLQKQRRDELKKKWGPLQEQIRQKQLKEGQEFVVKRHIVSYKKMLHKKG